MICNKSLITREEAHWSSFRSAVIGIQHSLSGSGDYLSVSVDPPENDGESSCGILPDTDISVRNDKEQSEKKKADPIATSANAEEEEEVGLQNNNGDKKDPPENDVGICRTRENQALVDKVKKLSSGKKIDAPILASADTEKEGTVQLSNFSDSCANRQHTSSAKNVKPQSASFEFDSTENSNRCTLQPEKSIANCNNSWDDKSIELKNNNNSSHPQLELIGNLEEVKRNIQSRNNNTVMTHNDDILSPMNAHQSHTSHTTNAALSIAEQQLTETKLKLAMTEMERDELEFQLMQNDEQWN